MVYQITGFFPVHERFGLSSQFQRAAVSIPANIAEGYKKISKADKFRLMNVAQGSLEECRYYLEECRYYILLSKDLYYVTEEDYLNLTRSIEDVSRLLNSYCKAIANSK